MLWALLVLGCASSETQNTNPEVSDRLAPLTDTQKVGVIAIIKGTDEIDVIYDRRSNSRIAVARYTEKFEQTHEKFEQVYAALPKNDARMMLYNMMQGYENVGSLLLAKSQRKSSESPDPMMLAARMRKVLLKKIVDGNLSQDEKRVIEVLRQQDK